MKLIETINKDYQNALKNKDDLLISVLRLLRSNIHNQEISKKGKLSEEDTLKVIQKELKKRKDSIEAFKKGERIDLAEKEKQELDILSKYLPKQLSKEEIKIFVQKIIDKNKDEELNFGKIMGEVMKEMKGKADGKEVNEIVRELMQEKNK